MNFDTRQIVFFERTIERISKRGIPRAIRDAINDAAFAVQKKSRGLLGSEFVERNKFTRRSIVVNKSRSLVLGRQRSEVGSLQSYMERLEFGFVHNRTMLNASPVPTASAAGQDEEKKRTRTVRLQNRKKNLKGLKKSNKFASGLSREKRQAAIFRAASANKFGKFFVLPVNDGNVVLKVTGKRRKGGIVKARMMYALPNKQLITPPHPWLAPVTDKVATRLPIFYKRGLTKQLRFLQKTKRI